MSPALELRMHRTHSVSPGPFRSRPRIRRTCVGFGVAMLLIPGSLAQAEESSVPHVREPIDRTIDTDGDSIPDWIEIRTGTDPYAADTDSDGIPDGVEDANQDGVVDPGESDPRVAGLFPGSAPHIPEPLVFDLVRGLGAARGELEVNNLAVVDLRSGSVGWAPEVEWAFVDGHAIELELPMADRELEALKLAFQGTLPGGNSHFVHGWQTIGEYLLDDRDTEIFLLYIAGQRFAPRMSWLGIAGPRITVGPGGHREVATVLNLSLFGDVREWQTLGFETNAFFGPDGEWYVRLFPQIHLQMSEHVRVQLSAGVDVIDGGARPTAAARVILE